MERIARSWELVRASWSVLRSDKELLIFPLVSAIATLAVVAAFAVPAMATGTFERVSDRHVNAVDVILGFLFYVVTYTVAIFCNSALIGAANIRLQGGNPTLGDGFRIAFSRLPQIVAWAVISATVGMLLRAIADRGGILGVIASSIVGFVWAVITFLVVPILVIEGIGPIEAIRRSGALLRQTWGEQLVGTFSIGLIMGLLILAVLVVGFVFGAILIAASPALGVVVIVLAVVAVIALGLVSAALSGIYNVALYRYATGNPANQFFNQGALQGAFRQKR